MKNSNEQTKVKNKKAYLEQSRHFLQDLLWERLAHRSLCETQVLRVSRAAVAHPGRETRCGTAQMCSQSCCRDGAQEGKVLSKWNES